LAKADFGKVAITEIKPTLILECLRKVEAEGIYETAQRLRAKVSADFRFAAASGVAEFDPAQSLSDARIRPKPKSRTAITEKMALGAVLRAIDGFEGQVKQTVATVLREVAFVPEIPILRAKLQRCPPVRPTSAANRPDCPSP
jgi:integrase